MKRQFKMPRIPALFKANIIVFISSFCVMVVELIAARILAPHIGVSLYTWTSIIGVILVSIAVGNYIGGRLADKYASSLILVAIFAVGGLATVGIIPATRLFAPAHWLDGLPPMLNFTLKTGFIFLVPALILSMVSPLVIKLTLADLGRTGGIVGTIYAVSTAGAIVGTFMTGFFFILWFGLRMIVWLVALALILTGIATFFAWNVPDRWKFTARNIALWAITIVVIIASISLFQMRAKWQEHYTRESNYYSIQVRPYSGKVKILALDHLIHAYVIPDEPTYLQYEYLKVFKEIVQYINPGGKPIKALHLGGGGYSFPRYLEAVYPGSLNEVVEIDPAVTEVVYAELGLPRDTTIKTYNLDARQFLINRSTGPRYDIVVGDVFNDFSTPYHLTTLEFDEMVKANMEREGVYLINLIDSYQHGSYMASVIHTLKHVFNNVYLFGIEPGWGYAHRSTYVLAATDRTIDLADFKSFVSQEGHFRGTNPHDEAKLEQYVTARAVLLTDEYCPTDILLARTQR